MNTIVILNNGLKKLRKDLKHGHGWNVGHLLFFSIVHVFSQTF